MVKICRNELFLGDLCLVMGILVFSRQIFAVVLGFLKNRNGRTWWVFLG